MKQLQNSRDADQIMNIHWKFIIELIECICWWSFRPLVLWVLLDPECSVDFSQQTICFSELGGQFAFLGGQFAFLGGPFAFWAANTTITKSWKCQIWGQFKHSWNIVLLQIVLFHNNSLSWILQQPPFLHSIAIVCIGSLIIPSHDWKLRFHLKYYQLRSSYSYEAKRHGPSTRLSRFSCSFLGQFLISRI